MIMDFMLYKKGLRNVKINSITLGTEFVEFEGVSIPLFKEH